MKVFETGNPALIAVIESVLDDAQIEYGTSSENLQDLFGWGRLGAGYNYVIGPVKFFVAAEDEEEARALLATLHADVPPSVLPAD